MRKTRMSIALLVVTAAGALFASIALAATITGTNDDELLRGTDGNDTISAAGGRDVVQALAGDDTVSGGWGRDRVFAGAGNDTVDGDRGNDRVFGAAGNDSLSGSQGNDRIFGGLDNDQIQGGFGHDVIYGGAGNDQTNGGPQGDRIFGGSGDDVSAGGAGNDLILANLGVDKSFGGPGNDNLWALARGDVHPGPNGEVDTVGDTLDGGTGNDRFHTRDGEVDTISCGPGHDRAILDMVDVIADATPGNPKGSCEVVKRAAPKAADAQAEPDTSQETTQG